MRCELASTTSRTKLDSNLTPTTTTLSELASWTEELQLHGQLLDGIEVAMCAFDLDDRAQAWNRTFLRFFPEHEGHVHRGEPYAANLRRFYEYRLDAAEAANIDAYIEAGIERHRSQGAPYQFVHRGARLQVSSLPVPGRGRIRVWRALDPLPSGRTGMDAFAAQQGHELLDRVPEALVVCANDGRIVWANSGFAVLYDQPDAAGLLGLTTEQVYRQAWSQAAGEELARKDVGLQSLRENLRFDGAPFDLPLPGHRYCRVIARPARDGAIFYAHIDITSLKRFEEALQLTLDKAGRGIIRYDAGGRIVLYNSKALELLELPRELLQGSPLLMDIVRFQQERGEFDGDVLRDIGGRSLGVQDAAGFALGSDHYLRRTPSGRVLEVATEPLADGGAVRTYSDVTAYVDAQTALREKSLALQITLDSMGQGISAIDAAGRLMLWNKRYEELLALPRSFLDARPSMEQIVRYQIDRGDFGPNFEFVDAVARGYVAVGDKVPPMTGPETYTRKTRDGKSLSVVTRPLPDGGVVRTFSDVSAYVESQEALAQKQAQLTTFLNNLPDSVWLKDTQGVYVLSNPAHQRSLGLREDQIIGKGVWDLFEPERALRRIASDRQAMDSQEPISFEESLIYPDGSVRHVEIVKAAVRATDGRPTGVLGIARDITERKASEQALIQAKEEALQASSAKSRFLSSMSHEIRTPMNAILGMLTLIRGTQLTARQEDYASKAEGAARSLLSLLNDILDFSKIEAGKMSLDLHPFSLEGMLTDLGVILSSNVGDKDLEVLYDLDPEVPDLLVGDDMRLRQILINLGGNAVKFTEHGEVILRIRLRGRTSQAATIEFDVQDSGIGITPEQQVRLFSDYEQASSQIARQYGGTGLGLTICRRLIELMGGELQLASTPGVGSRFWFTVTLPVGSDADLAQPVPPSSAAKKRVLVVDDNPLARDTLATICRSAGWSADTAQDGAQALARVRAAAGMGMAYEMVLVDWLMPGMDGWQTCAALRELPLPGRMPLIVMVTARGRERLDRLPVAAQNLIDGYLVKPVTPGMLRAAAQERTVNEIAEAPPQESSPLAGLNILVAEDNPINQQIASELLTRQGANVDVVTDGMQAVVQVHSGASYDIVLMDMQMPEMDGLEATRHIRRLVDASFLPIVAMTANAMESDRQACLAAGMNDHVSKPFVLEELVAKIQAHTRAQLKTGARRSSGSSAGGSTPPLYDSSIALGNMGGDQELLDEVLPVFQKSLQEYAKKLEPITSPSKELEGLAHTIKGAAATVGAMALASAAARLEDLIKDEVAVWDQQALNDVRRCLDETLTAIAVLTS